MSGGFDTETRKWLVSGRVQGVGYRAFAARTGRGLGLSGEPPQPRGHRLAPFDPALLAVQRRRAPFWRTTE